MGEAKKKTAAQILASAGAEKELTVEVSHFEMWYLVIHLRSGSYVPEGHDAINNLSELVDAFGVAPLYRMMLSNDPAIPEVQHALLQSGESDVIKLRQGVVNFFLDSVTKGKMINDAAVALTPLIQRLKDAKSGAYTAPDSLPVAQLEAASGQTPEVVE